MICPVSKASLGDSSWLIGLPLKVKTGASGFLKSDTSFKKKTLLAQSAIRKFSLKECVRGYEKIFDKI